MPGTTLIAYATRSGSTEEVAEMIHRVLCDAGMSCDLVRMRDAQPMAGFSNAVLGVPLYMGRFLKECHEFFELNKEQLEKMQVWCFVLGPVENKPAQFEASRREAAAQLARHPWLSPIEVEVFGGCWDVARMKFPLSLLRLIPAGGMAVKDARDWGAICRWAEGIAQRNRKGAEQTVKPNYT